MNKTYILIALATLATGYVALTQDPPLFERIKTDIDNISNSQPSLKSSLLLKTTEIESQVTEDTYLATIRPPRGFSDNKSVERFALDYIIIDDNKNMYEPISIHEVCRMISLLHDYYAFPKAEIKDKVTLIKFDSTYENLSDVNFCLAQGYVTDITLEDLNKHLTINEFTRITYRILLASLPTVQIGDDEINAMLDITGLDKETTPECRITKYTFLHQYDVLPINFLGEVPLDKEVTKQDALNMLIKMVDTIDFYKEDTDNPNEGCAPCNETALTLEREKYSETKNK